MKIDYFECSCYSPENRLVFHYDEEDNELYTEVYLFQYHNIFQRIWIAIHAHELSKSRRKGPDKPGSLVSQHQ